MCYISSTTGDDGTLEINNPDNEVRKLLERFEKVSIPDFFSCLAFSNKMILSSS